MLVRAAFADYSCLMPLPALPMPAGYACPFRRRRCPPCHAAICCHYAMPRFADQFFMIRSHAIGLSAAVFADIDVRPPFFRCHYLRRPLMPDIRLRLHIASAVCR